MSNQESLFLIYPYGDYNINVPWNCLRETPYCAMSFITCWMGQLLFIDILNQFDFDGQDTKMGKVQFHSDS